MIFISRKMQFLMADIAATSDKYFMSNLEYLS